MGNTGRLSTHTIRLDSESPSMSLDYGGNGGLITPNSWYNTSCSDDVLFEKLTLEIWSGTSLVYQINSTTAVQLRYGTVSSLNTNSNLQFITACFDVAGNSISTEKNLELVVSLNQPIVVVQSVNSQSTNYIID